MTEPAHDSMLQAVYPTQKMQCACQANLTNDDDSVALRCPVAGIEGDRVISRCRALLEGQLIELLKALLSEHGRHAPATHSAGFAGRSSRYVLAVVTLFP